MSFDGVLNLSYDINRFYDYSVKKHDVEKVGQALKALKKLKEAKRQLELIPDKQFTDNAIVGLEMLCEYLTHKDKKYIYVFGGRSINELYKCFCEVFRNKKATSTEIYFSMQKFYSNIEELSTTGYLDFESNKEYNYIYYFNKEGELHSRELPIMLDTLFNCKIRTEIELLISISL